MPPQWAAPLVEGLRPRGPPETCSVLEGLHGKAQQSELSSWMVCSCPSPGHHYVAPCSHLRILSEMTPISPGFHGPRVHACRPNLHETDPPWPPFLGPGWCPWAVRGLFPRCPQPHSFSPWCKCLLWILSANFPSTGAGSWGFPTGMHSLEWRPWTNARIMAEPTPEQPHVWSGPLSAISDSCRSSLVSGSPPGIPCSTLGSGSPCPGISPGRKVFWGSLPSPSTSPPPTG